MADNQPADEIAEAQNLGLVDTARHRCVRRHLAAGWWLLLIYLTSGAVLEVLHGWKAASYLDPQNETRRLMWTLAHAHGALLALVHLGFAATVGVITEWPAGRRGFAGTCLGLSSVLIPGGFFLGLFVAVLLAGLSVKLKVPPDEPGV
jgi:hypothetical protein